MRWRGAVAVMVLVAAAAWAAPYTAPNVIGRSIPACVGAGDPFACCTGAGVGNCINDSDFTDHTEALERLAWLVFNVKDYGAAGDGTTNDTTAIRDAITAASSAGGTVFFPCGTYSVTSPSPGSTAALSVNASKVTLRGASRDCAILTFPNATTDIRLLSVGDSGTPTIDGFVVRDLWFVGNGANWGASGGHNAITRGSQGTVNNTLIENVRFSGFYKSTITNTSVISWGANSWNGLTLRNLVLDGNRALGLNLFCSAGTCGNFTIENVSIDNTGATAATPQQNVVVSNSVTLGSNSISDVRCGTRGVCAGHCILNQADNVAITGNTAVGCPYDQIVVSGQAQNVAVTGNTAVNGLDGGFGFEAGTGTDGPTGITFTGNVARGNYSVGLFVINTKRAVITGNTFDGNCTNPTPPTGCAGVYISGESGHTSVGNLLSGNAYIDTQGSPTQKYGVQLITAFTDLTEIEGGTFAGNTTAAYRLDAATNTRISGYSGGTLSLANSPTYSISGPETPGVAFASLGSPQNGSMVYCSDCTAATPCAGSGTGALAKRLNGAWDCGGGGGGSGTVTSVDCSTGLTCSPDPITGSGTITNAFTTGVSGGQTAIGGTASGNDLTLQSTTNATKGDIIIDDAVQLWPAMPATGTQKLLRYDDTTTFTGTMRGLDFGPDMTWNPVGQFALVRWGGTFTSTVSTPSSINFMSGLLSDYLSKSTTDGVAPWLPDVIMDIAQHEMDGNIAGTGVNIGLTMTALPTYRAKNSAEFSVSEGVALGAFAPTFVADGSGSILNIPRRAVIWDRVGLYTQTNGGNVNVDKDVTIYSQDRTKDGDTELLAFLESDISAGTGKYFLHSAGTAVSAITGGLRIGDTTQPTEKLEVAGNALTTGWLKPRTGLTTIGAAQEPLLLYDQALSTTSAVASLYGLRLTGTWTSSDGLANTHVGLLMDPALTNTTGGTFPQLLPGVQGLRVAPTITTTIASSGTASSSVFSMPSYRQSGAGTWATLTREHSTVDSRFETGPSVTWGTRRGFRHWTNHRGGTCSGGSNPGATCYVSGSECTGGGTCTATLSTIDTDIALDVEDTSGGATTPISLRSAGATVPMKHAGPILVGSSSATASARLQVSEPTTVTTTPVEAVRVESVAANDDPRWSIWQCRITTTGNVTDSTLCSLTLADNKVSMVKAAVTMRCTANCATVGTGGAGEIAARFRKTSGTATELGSDVIVIDWVEDTDGTANQPTLDIVSNNLQVRVTTSGDSDINEVWHVTLFVYEGPGT